MCIPFLASIPESGPQKSPEQQAPAAPVVEPEPEAPAVTDPTRQTPVAEEPEPEQEEAPEDTAAEEPEAPAVTDPTRQTPVAEEPEPEQEEAPEDTAAEEPEAPAVTDPTRQTPVAEEPEPEQEEAPEPPEPTGRELPVSDDMAVAGGRVTTLDPALENVASIEITGKPVAGNLTVNPDNTLALVLTGTDHSGPLSFSYTATFENGTTQTFNQTVDVQPLAQMKGWGTGQNIYMLETDTDGNLVIEHGDEHRAVHVTKGDTALSRADVAAMNGLKEADINAKWLLDHSEYGSAPEMALDEQLGSELWRALTDEPGAHWLLLERGHDYDFKIFPKNLGSESELHPTYIGAYGEGSAPRATAAIREWETEGNIVIDGIEFGDSIFFGNTKNLILNDLVLDGHGVVAQGMGGGSMEGITLRNSTIFDAVRDTPVNDRWGDTDKIQGLYAAKVEGLLVEGVHFDHTGWEEGYSPDGDAAAGQWPSKMSHNVYIQFSNSDVTFRDNILMRGASFGAQVRSGGFIEDNVFIDNNAAVSALGGEEVNDGTYDRNFSLLSDNLVTSAGAKVTDQVAARSVGIRANEHSVLLDNIVAHLADPNNPAEFEEKLGAGAAVKTPDGIVFDNTVVYNWIAQNFGTKALENNVDRNVDGVGPAEANQTTIQNFTAALLDNPEATIDDLGQFLRGQVADGQVDAVTADDIVAYFQETFGIAPDVRFGAETLRFVPNDLGDGVRWDNRINWTTEDLPGTVAGDSADLGGNWVVFGTITGTVQDLEFGSGGQLAVTSGRLNVEGETSVGQDGGEIDVRGAGQIWLSEYRDEDQLDIDIEGGRFANTGFFEGLLDLHVTDGQALLGVDTALMELGAGTALEIEGSTSQVGFDGEAGGVSVLRMETGSQLRMIADENGFSTIEEFRSGAHDTDKPDVLSAFDMGEGTLLVDISAIAGGQAREEVLVDTDEVFGMFDDVEFVGLGDNQDATLTVDYENDRVTVSLSEANSGGTGQVNIVATGAMVTGMEDDEIWNALIEGQNTYLEDDANIPDLGASKTLENEELEAETA